MKQILTYISSDKCFNKEHQMAAKIQIDNSYRLGWKSEDIILATNFDYEYNGVKSLVIGDDNYCSYHWPATKIYVVNRLFRDGVIGDGLYWYHDFDCFQLNELVDAERDLKGADMGVTNYGRMPRLCSASILFRKTAEDILSRLKEYIDTKKVNEERGLARLINESKDLKTRVKLLNNTYAFQKWNMWHSYCRSDKPIKAVHFHLTPDKYDFFVEGNNRVNLKIIPEGLVKIFNNHGFNK